MKKVSNNILENLRDTIKLSNLDDDTIEKIINRDSVSLYKCINCGNIFNKDNTISVKTDMEDYYGVGSDFYDHHYENLSGCPNCKSTDIEDLGSFELEDFEDYQLYEATKWKHYSGEYLGNNMDDGYEQRIQERLLPLLNMYDIKMNTKPFVDKPGKQVYYGDTEDSDEIVLTFYNAHRDKLQNREGQYDMLVKLMYNGKEEEVGVIDLDTEENIENAFSLITMSLENLGFKLNNSNEESNSEESDEDRLYKDILNFKKGLKESELAEIISE